MPCPLTQHRSTLSDVARELLPLCVLNFLAMIKQMLKNVAEAVAPSLALTYRELRDKRFASKSPSIATPFGFHLAGSEFQASGAFEDEETRIFLGELERTDVCIDVGANIGLYSCLAASRHKRIVAVEPLVSNLGLLYRNLLQNGFQAEVFPVGLGDQPEIKCLYGGGTGASFIENWANTPKSWNRIVPVTTLDVVAGKRFSGQRLLIKIDVEGFEYRVLQGASATMALKPSPVWLVEICLDEHFPGHINPNFLQTFQMFWDAGYQASVGDQTRRSITPADISKWIASGHVEFGTHNYIFSAAPRA